MVSSFSDGLAAVEVSGKLGYIDHSGRYAIRPQFVAGTDFEDGIARVVADGPCTYSNYEHFDPCMRMSPYSAPNTGPSRNAGPATGSACKWRFIDKTGKPIVAAEFEGAIGFHEGLAAVRVGEQWGFINLQGVMVIPLSFRAVHSFSNGLALVSKDKQSGFIDKTGTLKIPVGYSKAEPFSDGLAVVGDIEQGFIFINSQGKQAIPERFVLASRFFHGLAHVKLRGSALSRSEGSFAYIDSTGRRVFTYER